MKMRVVYADVLFAINWIVDYFLLLGAAALAGCSVRRRRLLAGAALGGASAFIFFAPQLPLWAQLLYQLASGTLVVLASYRVYRARSYIKLWCWYFLLNLCFSGLVLALCWWLSFTGLRRRNLAFYCDVSPLMLVGCIVGLYALLRLLLLLFDRPAADRVVRAHAVVKGERLDAEVLLDSGFTATDVMAGLPLLLLSYPDTVGRAQPALRARLEPYFSPRQGLPVLAAGLRLVPLHTAGGPALVPGLTADAEINGHPLQLTLAFSPERFRAGQVQGLFGQKSYEMMGGC